MNEPRPFGRRQAVTHDVDEAGLLPDSIVMLTDGPNALVGEIPEAELPRPRDCLAPAAGPRFVAARAAVPASLHHRHTAPGLAAA
jgi:nitrate/nitrite transport system ATP-binding protein